METAKFFLLLFGKYGLVQFLKTQNQEIGYQSYPNN